MWFLRWDIVTQASLLFSNQKLAQYGPWAKSGHLHISASSYTGAPLHPIVHLTWTIRSIHLILPMADFTHYRSGTEDLRLCCNLWLAKTWSVYLTNPSQKNLVTSALHYTCMCIQLFGYPLKIKKHHNNRDILEQTEMLVYFFKLSLQITDGHHSLTIQKYNIYIPNGNNPIWKVCLKQLL